MRYENDYILSKKYEINEVAFHHVNNCKAFVERDILEVKFTGFKI